MQARGHRKKKQNAGGEPKHVAKAEAKNCNQSLQTPPADWLHSELSAV